MLQTRCRQLLASWACSGKTYVAFLLLRSFRFWVSNPIGLALHVPLWPCTREACRLSSVLVGSEGRASGAEGEELLGPHASLYPQGGWAGRGSSAAQGLVGIWSPGSCLDPRERETISHSVVSDSWWPQARWPAKFLCPWNSPRKDTGVGCHFLLQGIFPTQGSNLGLWHCKRLPYHLSHQAWTPKSCRFIFFARR